MQKAADTSRNDLFPLDEQVRRVLFAWCETALGLQTGCIRFTNEAFSRCTQAVAELLPKRSANARSSAN
jgi:hypothetical protein